MGLDFWEMLAKIESSFKIKITDEQLNYIITVGDLYSYITERINLGLSTCPNIIIFHKIRTFFVDSCKIFRKDIKLDTKVGILIPLIHRKLWWDRFQKTLGYILPDLNAPYWVSIICCLIGIVICVFTFPILYFTLPFFFTICKKLEVKYGYFIPIECTTVKDTIQYIIKYNGVTSNSNTEQWNNKKIWDVICNIISEYSTVQSGNIKKEMKLHVLLSI